MLKKVSAGLTLLFSLLFAHISFANNSEMACGPNVSSPDCVLIFTSIPTITDMDCGDPDQVVIYTIQNISSVPVDITEQIEILEADTSPSTTVDVTGVSCGNVLLPGESCDIEVTISVAPCLLSKEEKLFAAEKVRRLLEIFPTTSQGPQRPISALIALRVNTTDVISKAYIANQSNDSVIICSVTIAATLSDCVPFFDTTTFDAPADVILNMGASPIPVAYVANVGNNKISICDVDSTTGYLVDPCDFISLSIDFSGLRLNADNSILYVTHYDKTVYTCPVDLDGGLTSGCTSNTNAEFTGIIGRTAFNLDETALFIPDFAESNVVSCTTDFITCNDSGGTTFYFPVGMDTNIARNFAYVANADDTVSICGISGDTLTACLTPSNGDGTFDFASGQLNLFTSGTNGYGYFPNTGSGSISICPLDPSTGAIGACFEQVLIDPAEAPNLTSAWIETFAGVQQLYVGNFSTTPAIKAFDLPLTNASTPFATVPSYSGNASGFAFDAFGNVYVADATQTLIQSFTLPLTNASTPASSFIVTNTPQGVLMDAQARLFVSETGGNIEVFNPPYGLANLDITLQTGGSTYQMVFDNLGNLIVADCLGAIQVFNPPFLDTQTPDLTVPTPAGLCAGGVALNAAMDKLYVTSPSSFVLIYDLPLVGFDTPSDAIISPATLWGPNLAFDLSDNLYTGDWDTSVPANSSVHLFLAPVTGSTIVSAINVLAFIPFGLAVR